MSDLVSTEAAATATTTKRAGKSYRDNATDLMRVLTQTIVESAVLLLLLLLVERSFFDKGFFDSLNFHPFWVVILLGAVQHGVIGGVVAAGLASVLLDPAPRQLGIDITDHSAALALQPLIWLSVALLVGLYRTLQIHEEARLRDDLARSQERNTDLAEELRRMDTALSQSELALVSRSIEPEMPYTELLSSLRGLFHASMSVEDFVQAFVSVSKTASPLRSGLLLPNASGFFEEVTGARVLAGVELPLQLESLPLQRVARNASGSVIAGPELGYTQAGYVVVAGVGGGRHEDLNGIVVLEADDLDSAHSALPVADILAIACAAALSAARDTDGQDNNRVLAAVAV